MIHKFINQKNEIIYVDVDNEEAYTDTVKEFIVNHYNIISSLCSGSVYYLGASRRFLDLESSISKIIKLKERLDTINSLGLKYLFYESPVIDKEYTEYIIPDTINFDSEKEKEFIQLFVTSDYLPLDHENYFLVNGNIKVISDKYIKTDMTYNEFLEVKRKKDIMRIAEEIYNSNKQITNNGIKEGLMYFIRKKFFENYETIENKDQILKYLNLINYDQVAINQDGLLNKLKNYKTYRDLSAFIQDVCNIRS